MTDPTAPAGSGPWGNPPSGGPVPPPQGVAAGGMSSDPRSGLLLPDGVTLASSGRRIGAYFLAIPLSVVTLVVGYAIWGLIVWGRGQTPALQVLGMRCWRPETGRPASWGWMALREIIGRFAEGILGIFTLLPSFILMLARRDHRCIHDLIAGTVVVHDPQKVLAR